MSVRLEGNLTADAPVHLTTGVVQLKAACIQLNFGPIVGISGGPVTYQGKVIGMNSFGDPASRTTWAVKLPKNI